ncbi:PAS domain-containing sensor histidine kinase [Fodinibius salsisoli]|uniref:PAS domain S-box protein n=1 Tax=Fodinibius salsisoli TaxID=2820877 RepID=A0ABT3PIU3_9BACT|nr:PAS domain S-box protein [Fodinibius salsisoli]MCW9705859.1 PAS domain S-box protein [Fodinibius salsisoli]
MSSHNDDSLISSVPEEDLSTILDSLPTLVTLIDLDGTITYWNEGGEKVFGYSASEIVGQPTWMLYANRGQSEFREELKVLGDTSNLSFETEGVRHDGSRIWIEVKKVLIKNSKEEPVILGTISDISLQKKAEFDLAQSRARIEAILETTVEGIITISKRGIIKSFNKAAEEMFQYHASEVIGKNVSVLMPAPYQENHDQYISNYLETGERKIIGLGREVRGKKKDGTIFPIDLAVSETKFDNEIIFTGMIKDISERRKLENEVLEIAEDERRRIGQELHDDFGQMLSGISLITRNLARKLKANGLPVADEVMEIADMIRETDERARKLAHGLAHIELENEGLGAALAQLCKRFEKFSDIRCRFECDNNLEPKTKRVILHLYRIVQEAISNAHRHGKPSIIIVRLHVKEQYLRLIIEDNGSGFLDGNKMNEIKGMGMRTMQYRAHTLGGNMDFAEAAEGGAQVVCTIPLTNLEIVTKI